jgi:hypothetical protein
MSDLWDLREDVVGVIAGDGSISVSSYSYVLRPPTPTHFIFIAGLLYV